MSLDSQLPARPVQLLWRSRCPIQDVCHSHPGVSAPRPKSAFTSACQVRVQLLFIVVIIIVIIIVIIV